VPVGSSDSATPPTIAAAILASYQPLTIRSLNTQLLQVKSQDSPDGAQTAQAGNRAVSSSALSTGIAPAEPPEQPASAVPLAQEDPRTGDSEPPADLPAGHVPSEDKRLHRLDQPEPSPRTREEQRNADAASPTRLSQQSAPTTTAAAAPNQAATKPTDTANPRQPQSPMPLVASVSGASGRKAGEDAHMPRWDAQKLTHSKQQDETTARTNALVTAQAARGLAAALTRRDGSVTLRLNPASLGFLRIKLEMSKGSVIARFEASTQQARQLLERSSETLRASLEAKGWEASQVRVELLREADPAAEMLRRLEQFGESAAERQAAQDATAGHDRGSGSSGGDRRNEHLAPGSSAHDRAEESEATGDPTGELAGTSSVIGMWSRLDTTV
jgi:flagellar hook-length control protein FliK